MCNSHGTVSTFKICLSAPLLKRFNSIFFWNDIDDTGLFKVPGSHNRSHQIDIRWGFDRFVNPVCVCLVPLDYSVDVSLETNSLHFSIFFYNHFPSSNISEFNKRPMHLTSFVSTALKFQSKHFFFFEFFRFTKP